MYIKGEFFYMNKCRGEVSLFIKAQMPAYVLSVILAILSVLFGILPYYIIYKILTALLSSAGISEIVPLSMYMLLSYLLHFVLHNVSTAISHKTAFNILEEIRLNITMKMLNMPLGYIKLRGSGYFHNMLIDAIERLEYPLAHAIPETTSSVLLPAGIIVLLFFIDYRMGLSILIPVVLILIIHLPLFFNIMNEFANTYYSSLENMNLRIIEYIRGSKEIKIFGMEDRAYYNFEKSIDDYKTSTLRLYNKMYFVMAPALVVFSSIFVSVLIVGGFLYVNHSLEPEIYLLSILISLGIGEPLLKITELLNNLYHIKNGKRLIKDVLSAPELSENSTELHTYNGNDIILEHVSFAYEDQLILKDISIKFTEGSKNAIVGPSGSGKSTIANLLAKFWEQTDGHISIGGVSYKDISLSDLMGKINYVSQDTFLFNMSIKDNIKLGNPNASDEEVARAARAAICEDFILNLDRGYDTVVGNGGFKLSGGERQRIVIARAILKNAPVLILDEATAFADMENQHKIQESLNALSRNKTLIIIAHRLSTVKDCSQIVVMDNGTVDSSGNHEELLQKSSVYKKLWDVLEKNKTWGIKGEMENDKDN